MFQSLIGRLKISPRTRPSTHTASFQSLIGRLKIFWEGKGLSSTQGVSIPYRQAKNTSLFLKYPLNSTFQSLIGRLKIQGGERVILLLTLVSIPYRQAKNFVLYIILMRQICVSIPYRQAKNTAADFHRIMNNIGFNPLQVG